MLLRKFLCSLFLCLGRKLLLDCKLLLGCKLLLLGCKLLSCQLFLSLLLLLLLFGELGLLFGELGLLVRLELSRRFGLLAILLDRTRHLVRSHKLVHFLKMIVSTVPVERCYVGEGDRDFPWTCSAIDQLVVHFDESIALALALGLGCCRWISDQTGHLTAEEVLSRSYYVELPFWWMLYALLKERSAASFHEFSELLFDLGNLLWAQILLQCLCKVVFDKVHHILDGHS